MAIRPATLEDAEAIVAVHVSSWRWAYQGIVPEATMNLIADPNRVQRIRQMWDPLRANLVALDEKGAVVGFARENIPPGLEGYDCEIGSLYVHADHARYGHGRDLVRVMATIFADRGDVSMCIHTLKENRIGRSFYDKIGGAFVGEDKWDGLSAVWYGWQDLSELIERLECK